MSTTLTFEQARTEMLDLFETAWDAGPVSPVPPLTLDDNRDVNPTVGAPWARVTIKFGDAHQVGTAPLGFNAALFRRHGHVWVDIFIVIGTGLVTMSALAKVAQDTFEGKKTASGVWFKNTKYRPIGTEPAWYHGQVLAEFTYDEIK